MNDDPQGVGHAPRESVGGPVAIAQHVEASGNRAFQARLKASIERHREILEKLAR